MHIKAAAGAFTFATLLNPTSCLADHSLGVPFPCFDIQQRCGIIKNKAETSYCLDVEKINHAILRMIWGALSEEAKSKCSAAFADNRDVGYSELLECVSRKPG